MQGRYPHAALRPAQVVRLVLSRAGRRRGAAGQDAARVPAAEHRVRPDSGLPASAAPTVRKYVGMFDARRAQSVSLLSYLIFLRLSCNYLPTRLQQDAADRGDRASLGQPVPGPSRLRRDRDGREIPSQLSGEEVPGRSGGPSRRQPHRDDDHDLSIVHPRAGRRIRHDTVHFVHGDLRVRASW